uniref:Putative product n=1 Tax=Xenopsylla cheopis TaxID=163159 RepID=A0A6M2DMV8_XENCH
MIINSNQINYRCLMGSKSNIESMVRSFLTGLSTFSIVLSGTYFAQKPYLKRLPYKFKGSVVVSCLLAALTTYGVQGFNRYRREKALLNDKSSVQSQQNV